MAPLVGAEILSRIIDGRLASGTRINETNLAVEWPSSGGYASYVSPEDYATLFRKVYDSVKAVRPDAIIATGRSDYPNQVNNVLCFPYLFRGALDVAASGINEEMKLAAAKALANLAKEDVPDSVISAYGGKPIKFGRDYLIPKPFDKRVLVWEASAVAEAAMKDGVARRPLDLDSYRDELADRLDRTRAFVTHAVRAARAMVAVVHQDGPGNDRGRCKTVVGLDHRLHPVGGEHLERVALRRTRERMGILAEKQRTVDALRGAIVADRLGDGEDVVAVETAVQRAAAMAAGAEAHPLGGILHIRFALAVVALKRIDVDQAVCGRGLSRLGVYCHCCSLKFVFSAENTCSY